MSKWVAELRIWNGWGDEVYMSHQVGDTAKEVRERLRAFCDQFDDYIFAEGIQSIAESRAESNDPATV